MVRVDVSVCDSPKRLRVTSLEFYLLDLLHHVYIYSSGATKDKLIILQFFYDLKKWKSCAKRECTDTTIASISNTVC